MSFKYSKTDESIEDLTLNNGYYLLSAAKETIIKPKTLELINTGIKIQIPVEYFAHVSGSYGKIRVLAGVIDSDYRGELKVMIFNRSDESIVFKKSQTCAKMHIVEISAKNEVICE